MLLSRIVDHKIECKGPDGKYHVLCEEVAIRTVITDLYSGKQQVEIELFAAPGPVRFTLPREAVNRNLMPTLIGYGLTMIDNPDQANIILELVWDSEQDAVHVYRHSKLGFWEIDGELAFLAYHPVGLSNPAKSLSEHTEPERTKPSGTIHSWKAMVREEVLGRRNLELALALGASAPVAHLLRVDKVLTLVPIWALIGRSSTGKTMALKLMASLWGNPEEGSGMILDLNTTQNAFVAQLGQAYAMPALIDETSSVPEWDFTKLLYNLPKGRDKRRCNNDGSLKPPTYFSGAIVLTGERSLLDQTNGNQGILARLVEFSLPWTDNEQHAQRLEYGSRCNYGQAVYPLMRWLLKHRALLPKIFNAQYTKLKEAIGYSPGIEDRLIKMYSIIMTSACVVRASLKLPLNNAALRGLIIEQHRGNRLIHDDPAVQFEKIKHLILQNRACFPAKGSPTTPREVWGEFDNTGGQDFYWVREDVFETFAQKAGVSDLNATKRIFFEHGWLYRTADRHYTVEHPLEGVRVKCYRVYTDMPYTPPKVSAKKRASLANPAIHGRAGPSNINLLLDDGDACLCGNAAEDTQS